MRKSLFSLLVVAIVYVAMPVWANPIQVVHFDGSQPSPMGFSLSGTPEYEWYHGCSPTSGGMMIGYWDGHPSGKWSDLVEGDVSTQGNLSDPNDIVNSMIASPEHINDYWGTPDPNPGGHADNSIADFMHTSRSGEGLGDGGTWSDMIPVGLKDYAYWDDPTTATVEAYYSDSWLDYVGYLGGTFNWDAYKAEINAGNPMIIDLITYAGSVWIGHSVVGYGYQDDMFTLRVPTGSTTTADVTVGGFAVMDTWVDGSSPFSTWYDPSFNIVYPVIDASGREWWPFLDMTLTGGWVYGGVFDWQITEGVYFHPGDPVPEPSTILLLATGLGGMFTYGRMRFGRKKKS